MKTANWQRYLEEQARVHDKRLFALTELAHVASTSRRELSVELARLVKARVVERYGYGLYGLPGQSSPEYVLPWLDPHAYMTGAFALLQHGLITQAPAGITCFTDRRHDRSSTETPAGRYDFVRVSRSVYRPPEQGVIAGPEQALCDYVYLMRQRGVAPESQVTFRHLNRLRRGILRSLAPRYPATVRKHIAALLASPRDRR